MNVVRVALGLYIFLASLQTTVARESLSDAVLKKVAAEYYGRLELTAARETKLSDRSHQAMVVKVMPTPMTATGQVTDRWGTPVSGARVTIEREDNSRVLGDGSTDADGRFTITLDTSYRGLSLIITHDRKLDPLARWARGGIYGGIVDYHVSMCREIDKSFLTALVEEKDQNMRLRLLLEVVARRQFSLDDKESFPFLGRLRRDLLSVVKSGQFDREDEKQTSPADRCRHFLTMWCAPEDQERIDTWLAEKPHIRTPSKDFSATTIDQVCQNYANAYWGKTKPKDRTLNVFSRPIVDSTQTHAMVEYSVHYRAWGYEDRLILVKQKHKWHLKMVYQQIRMKFK